MALLKHSVWSFERAFAVLRWQPALPALAPGMLGVGQAGQAGPAGLEVSQASGAGSPMHADTFDTLHPAWGPSIKGCGVGS